MFSSVVVPVFVHADIPSLKSFTELIPEFEMKGKTQAEKDEEARIKKEADDLAAKAKTESELIELEEKEIEKLDTMEEDEEMMK